MTDFIEGSDLIDLEGGGVCCTENRRRDGWRPLLVGGLRGGDAARHCVERIGAIHLGLVRRN